MNKRKPTAFTLVEILMVMAVMSAMAAMLVVAAQDVTRTARLARTRSIIAAIDSVIQEQYESYRYRPLPVEIPNVFQPDANDASVIGYDVLASEAARVRLIMIRDLQRMEMPDRFADIVENPPTIVAAASPVKEDSSGLIIGTRDRPADRKPFAVTWYGGEQNNVPAKLAAYRDRAIVRDPESGNSYRLDVVLASNNLDLKDLVYQNQSAECLYLIMASTFVGGSSAIDSIPDGNIGDTDEDGLLEILDGWGRPLGFIRWPVGFVDPDSTLLEVARNSVAADDFDPFRIDFAYSGAEIASGLNPVSGRVMPWSMRPLILSAGSDNEHGIAFNPVDSSGTEYVHFNYTSPIWAWPVNVNYMGQERLGRGSGALAFPDPYLRVFINNNGGSGGSFTGLVPGQQLFPLLESSEVIADNVSNYSLQAAQ